MRWAPGGRRSRLTRAETAARPGAALREAYRGFDPVQDRIGSEAIKPLAVPEPGRSAPPKQKARPNGRALNCCDEPTRRLRGLVGHRGAAIGLVAIALGV